MQSASDKVNGLFACYRSIKKVIALITNKSFIKSIFSLVSSDSIPYFLDQAIIYNKSLCGKLLFNYLTGNELTNPQKERLVDHISVGCLNVAFYKNIVTLACERKNLILPVDKIIRILKMYIEKMKWQDRVDEKNEYSDEIENMKQTVENYRKNNVYLINKDYNYK